MPIPSTEMYEVTLGDRTFAYQRPWDGRPLIGRGLLAFDTETPDLGTGSTPPALVLASACAGGGQGASCLMRADQVGAFILAHPRVTWAMFNVSFDFWVVAEHLRGRGEEEALRAWWEAAESNRMDDTMLLDQLVLGAERDAGERPRNLAVVALERAGMVLDKQDPFRTRYGELLGRDWATVAEEGFFTYAIKDPIATLYAHRRLVLEAESLVERKVRHSPDFRPEMIGAVGLLTEKLQAKAAIALQAISFHGMHLDAAGVQATEAALRAELAGADAQLRTVCPDYFQTRIKKRTGEVVPVVNKKNGLQQKSEKTLQAELSRVLDLIEPRPRMPTTSKGLSMSTKDWAPFKGVDPFLGAWSDYDKLLKLVSFFAGMREPTVHPRYQAVVRTGRTACADPNIQQVPRDGRFRRLFLPSPGHLLLIADFKAIELCTLAAICRRRYGKSVLGDVLDRGGDPHAFTAAMFVGVPFDEFLSWKYDPTRVDAFDDARQLAKPINFGVPGGLGVPALMAYAKAEYNVDLTFEQARELRRKLIEEIYPEIGRYLSEDPMGLLAIALGADPGALWDAFDPEGRRAVMTPLGIRKVVGGKTTNAQGKPYSPGYVDRVWTTLQRACRVADLAPRLEAREASPALAMRLFGSPAVTATGRLRDGVSYTQARNTPFQALASDGAKNGLWRLLREGIRAVGFIHDEVLVELVDRGGYSLLAEAERAEGILCSSMADLVGGGVPITVESALSVCWTKKAARIIDGDRLLPWSPSMEVVPVHHP